MKLERCKHGVLDLSECFQCVPYNFASSLNKPKEYKMAQRIRYVNTVTEGIVVSKQCFIHPENGGRYLVEIDEPNLTFQVKEDLTGKTVATGRKVNLHQVKQAAKEELTKLGIVFENESRKVKNETNNPS